MGARYFKPDSPKGWTMKLNRKKGALQYLEMAWDYSVLILMVGLFILGMVHV